MAKKTLAYNTKLDKQVERYLAEPVTLNDIREYMIHREASGQTWLSVDIWVDAERFEQEKEEE